MRDNRKPFHTRLVGGLLHLVQITVLCLVMLAGGTVGQANAGPFDGTIYEILSEAEQDKVLQTLANELDAVRTGRAAQAQADAKAAKTLSQLLDEVYRPDKKVAWQEYSKKYAGMAVTALKNDSARFARIAGAASAGDYGALEAELPRVGARVFAELVSDVLDAKDMRDTKYVWDNVVLRAGTLEEVGVAFMNGDVDKAYAVAKAQVLSELESYTKDSVAGVINWVFSDVGIAPGQLYVQVIFYEIEFIKWSKIALSASFIQGCLDEYVKVYGETSGSKELALDAYESCALLPGAASAERIFSEQLKKAGLDPRTEVQPMLEAYRTLGTAPHNFYKNLYAKRIVQQEAELAAKLAVAQSEVRSAADTFSGAVGRRLSALAQDLMSEDDLETLFADTRKALAGAQADADAVLKASTGVVRFCEKFDAVKNPFEEAQSEMSRLVNIDINAHHYVGLIPNCGETDSDLLDDLAEAKRVRDVIEGAVGDGQLAMDATCAAKDSVASATDKTAARQFVQNARDAAARAAAAVEIGTRVHDDYTLILRNTSRSSAAPQENINMKTVRENFDKVEAALVELRTADPKKIEAQFTTARANMQSAQRSAENLIGHAEERLERVQKILKPFRVGPMGAEVKTFLKTLEQRLEPAQLCESRITEEWGLRLGMQSWKRRTIRDTPIVEDLEERLALAKKRCPEASGGTKTDLTPSQEIIQIYEDVSVASILLGVIKRGYELCFAEAALAYSNQWGNLPSEPTGMVKMPKVIGLEGEIAAGLVRDVGLSAKIVAQEAADKLEKTPGHVYAASATAEAELAMGTSVTLSTYAKRPLIEVPFVADRTPLEAKGVLEGAGFVAAAPSLGKPAPKAEDVGKAYSSNPAPLSKHEMFTPVSPLIYGSVVLIPVPAMKDMSVIAAVGQLAAHGDHFVYGDFALSNDRPEGSVLGNVHYSVPGAGEPVPAGTNVTLYFYPPVGDEIGNARMILPEIIGMPSGQAAGLLRGDDEFFAVPAAKDGDVAEGNQVPGTVQYSAPAVGSMGLRGSAVQLYVYTAPPIAENETADAETGSDEADQTSDDSSWIGTWRLTAEAEGLFSEARAIISPRPGGVSVKVQTLKDGQYEKGMELAMVVNAQNVLRFDPKILQEMDEAAAREPAKEGILVEPMIELAVMLRKIFETLQLSREGTKCTYRVEDPKKGEIVSIFTCIKQ